MRACGTGTTAEGKEGETNTFLVVNYFALVVLGHFVGVDPSVTYIASDCAITLSLIRNGLQERRTTRAWAAQDEAHLTGLEDTRRPLKDVGHRHDADKSASLTCVRSL